jgi:RNA polymerase sigma-70 factor (ECF subfamily)
MNELPQTRESLLLRIRDAADADSWEQFVSIYRPAIYRLARRRGLQDADAEDLAQRVLLSVSRAIGAWEKDPSRGSFRVWLLRVVRNAILNALMRGRPDAASGGTSVLERLRQQPAGDERVSELIEEEHQRAVFRWAAAQVQSQFQQPTWLAFWLTTVDGISIEAAAARLDKSSGSVYAARSRVMRRLQQAVRDLEGEQGTDSR